MATSSFKKKTGNKDANDTAKSEVKKVETPTVEQPANGDRQLATQPDRTLANPMPAFDDMSGAMNRDDVRLPRVNLVHKTSKEDMITQFGIRAFVLSKEVKLSDGTTPFEVTALRTMKDYLQKLPFGSDEQPATFKTPDEVRQNGGTVEYSREAVAEKIYFGPRMHIELIFAAPAEGMSEEGEALFPYEFKGVNYARALFTVSSSAYTSVGKDLATLRTQNKVMRHGLRFGKLMLSCVEKPHPKNPWLVPVIKYAGENPAELVEFFESLVR